MKIVLGNTRAGLRLKVPLKKLLAELGHEVDDVGMQEDGEFVPYYQAAANVARAVSEGKYPRGIAICGTGAGSVIVANKFKDVYAVHATSVYDANKAIAVNNANVLVLAEWLTPPEHAAEIVKAWLSANFGDGFTPEWTEFLRDACCKVKDIEANNFR